MTIRYWRALLLAVGFIAVSSGHAAAATWYVDDLNDGVAGAGTSDDPFRGLQRAIYAAASGDTIVIRAGHYHAAGAAYTETTCGNCDAAQFRQTIPATRGFLIRGKALTLQGE